MNKRVSEMAAELLAITLVVALAAIIMALTYRVIVWIIP